MPQIAVDLGWAAAYLSMLVCDYYYPRPKYGSAKRNDEENYWEPFLSTTSKIRFFPICKD